jgi:hypothetical protein
MRRKCGNPLEHETRTSVVIRAYPSVGLNRDRAMCIKTNTVAEIAPRPLCEDCYPRALSLVAPSRSRSRGPAFAPLAGARVYVSALHAGYRRIPVMDAIPEAGSGFETNWNFAWPWL